MKNALHLSILLALLGTTCPAEADDKMGHSRHGNAFDTGLRQKPWRMEGIGTAHFPITTKVPEAQEWFDQGNALLHSFWYEEAERSFRWCLKLDPECAMAYWGLARTGLSWSTGLSDFPEVKRYKDFLKEAVRRKDSVTPRERMYIEAWDMAMRAEGPERIKVLNHKLQELVLKHPEDIEAKSLFALFSIGSGNALGTEMIVRDILREAPDHPGAHHTRIHNWDGVFAQQAIASCQAYARIAPGIGHSNHMPGHNYSKIGMWHEAAHSMDAATRVELRYMNERLALPFETWNYAHNRNYLCYIQEQLGMVEAALQGANDLLTAPIQPALGEEPQYGTFEEGMTAQIRALIKFERWEEILKPGTIQWREREDDKVRRALAETLAYTGLGKTVDARSRLAELKELVPAMMAKFVSTDNSGMNPDENPIAIELNIAEGLICAAEGNLLDATGFLTRAAAIEKKNREAQMYPNDPPHTPWPANRLLGDVYLQAGEYRLAIQAYDRALEDERNDGFSLSGLAQAHFKSGNRDKAAEFASRLAYVWSGCDSGLKWKTQVEALGLAPAAPLPSSTHTPATERPYTPEAQSKLGPLDWEPFAAPKLDCLDTDGKVVSLESLSGKNVILVFYLGDQCPHCVEQLVALNAREADWRGENAVVLAVSTNTPQENKESEKLKSISIRLLSDQDHNNARRFTSYDDFEEMELHSTILIDTKGRVHWKRTGGDPFTDTDFLLKTLKRMNGKPEATTTAK